MHGAWVPMPHAGRAPTCAKTVHRRWAVLLLALVTFGAPATARAHGSLKSSAPAAGQQVNVVLRELRLLFTEAPALAFSRLELLGPSGAVPLSPLAIAQDSRRALVAAIPEVLIPGTYTVVWQMAGDDGHPVRGRYSFAIVSGAQVLPGTSVPSARGEPTAAITAPGQSPPPSAHHDMVSMPQGATFGAESPAYVAIRALLFVGLLGSIGALVFHAVVLRRVERNHTGAFSPLTALRHGAARVGLVSVACVGLAAGLRLIAQSYAMHPPGQTFDLRLIGAMLTSTVWGWGWLLQLVAVIVAIAGFLSLVRGGQGWGLAGVGVIAMAFTPALSGHAASAPALTGLALFADGLHVIGAGGWLGSLLLVLLVGIPAALRLGDDKRGAAVVALVSAFSPTALVFAGLAAATGVFSAWLHLGGAAPALWQSTYGQTLLLKLALLFVVAFTGAYNWLRVKPTLGTDGSTSRLRRSAGFELVVGTIIIIVTAVLVATATPMDTRAMEPTTSSDTR